MILQKVREYLGVGLAIVAALSAGYGVITSMRNDRLTAVNEQLTTTNNTLAQANSVSQESIATLVEQRKIDDGLLTKLDNQFKLIADQNWKVKKTLEWLRSNDEEFKQLLSERHPVELNGMLNDASGNPNPSGAADTTGNPE